ncbi:MAG: hypothetical protein IJB90_03275 [Clostridia bacterium]|nr:hypothetical protein [Clostridia bacterium]
MVHTKKIMIILMLVSAIICINTFSFAVENPDFYDPGGIDGTDSQKVGNIIGDVLATIRVIGICIAVVMLTIIGLKYILSSLEEKAAYKENMIPYIAGCFLLACATTIPSIVYDIVNK